jgi:hypothetical protein
MKTRPWCKKEEQKPASTSHPHNMHGRYRKSKAGNFFSVKTEYNYLAVRRRANSRPMAPRADQITRLDASGVGVNVTVSVGRALPSRTLLLGNFFSAGQMVDSERLM